MLTKLSISWRAWIYCSAFSNSISGFFCHVVFQGSELAPIVCTADSSSEALTATGDPSTFGPAKPDPPARDLSKFYTLKCVSFSPSVNKDKLLLCRMKLDCAIKEKENVSKTW